MPFSGGEVCLLFVTLFVVIADIVLAILLRLVLPRHITEPHEWYPVNGKQLKFEEAAKVCPCLLRVFPDGTDHEITFNKVEPKAMKRQITNSMVKQMEKYAFLVSLSIPAYVDDPKYKIFACNGMVVSNDSLLTTTKCVKDESEWFNLTVRSESLFWSKLGKEHSVVEVKNHGNKGLKLLKVSPPFAHRVLPFPPINNNSYVGNWTYAVSLGWDDDMYSKTLKYRFKYKPFDVEEWTSKKCGFDKANVCYVESESQTCDGISSKLLLTSCHQLLGMKTVCNGVSTFKPLFDTKNASMLEKLACRPVFKHTCNFTEVETCQY